MRTPRLLIAAVAVTVLAIGIAACGDDDATETTTTTAAVTTTTVAGVTTTAGVATTTAGEVTTTTAGGSDEAVEITVIAKDVAFDVDEITVHAGQEVTLILNNQDLSADEGHNIHVRTATNDYFTAIHTAPDTSEVVFTINEPGEYTFFCDTHSTEMLGTFIVNP